MNRLHGLCAAVLACMLWALPAQADRLFVGDFEPAHIEPRFPVVAGEVQLPDGPAPAQMKWLISELAQNQTTSVAEVQAHFVSAYDATEMKNFIDSVRASYPDGVIIDAVGVSPLQVVAVVDTPGSTTGHGWFVMQTLYSGSHKIDYLLVTGVGDTLMYPADQSLSLNQAANRFATLSTGPGLLVARLRRDQNWQCDPVIARNPDTLRATGSQFKFWVLGGVAKAVAGGDVTAADSVPLDADELAPGGLMNYDPVGTVFSLGDVATLMMVNSDNTATDHMHELLGRDWIEQVVHDSGHSDPDVLTPFLGISEQFHILSSIPHTDAQAWVNGTEAYQESYLHSTIEPMGSIVGDPFVSNNYDFMISGTWQASPMDICRILGYLRNQPHGSDAAALVDRALGGQAAQPYVRGDWDRVWYKGGSLLSATGVYDVLTHAWLLENAGQDPWVVVGMSNQLGGDIDEYQVQSVLARILEILDTTPPSS